MPHHTGARGDPVSPRRLEQQRALGHYPPCRLPWTTSRYALLMLKLMIVSLTLVSSSTVFGVGCWVPPTSVCCCTLECYGDAGDLRKRTMARAFVRAAAGHRDTDASTIFDKIVAKEIPSTVVFEDEKVFISLAWWQQALSPMRLRGGTVAPNTALMALNRLGRCSCSKTSTPRRPHICS